MRIRTTLLTGALLLASTAFAMAQQTPQTPPQQGQTTDVIARPQLGSFDFSFRTSDVTGDQARFQRYQDIRDRGAGLNFKFNREDQGWFFDTKANNVGYNDQAFSGLFGSGKMKGSFEWTETPLFYGAADELATPYSTSISGNVAKMTLDPTTVANVQAGKATGIVLNTSQLAAGSTFRALEVGTDVKSRRDNLNVNLTYQANRDVDVNFAVNSYARTGTQPWGAAFAFNDAVELPLPIDNRTTDVTAGVEWANQMGMLRLAYNGSYFANNIETLQWSNPLRATDSWNASSYSNGTLGGSSLGQMALFPSNHANTVSAAGLYKLPAHSSFNASLAVSSLSQNEALLPFTINSVLQPGTTIRMSDGSTWVGQAPERATAEGDVRVVNTNVNFTSRPNRHFGLTAKYRYYNWDNRTPIFHNVDNVRFDGAPEHVPGSESEYASLKRQSFDVDASFTPTTYGAFRIGYGREAADQTYREIPSYGENTFRASFDTIGNRYVMLRAMYTNSRRSGPVDVEVITDAGAQPDSRQFDVANRNSYRGALILEVAPLPVVGFSVSAFKGRDEYPDQQFGLLNNDNNGVTLGVDLTPTDTVTLSFNYGRENYAALQQSRNANPAPDPSWTDPNRNWNLNNTEKVNDYGVNLGLVRIVPKAEIRLGFDRSDSDQGFLYGGPRVAMMAATIDKATGLPTFMPLPDVTNIWKRATADFKYFLSPRVAIGATYMYDNYAVSDFASTYNPDGTPRYDPLGGLILGYGFRPYTANTGWFRVIYLF